LPGTSIPATLRRDLLAKDSPPRRLELIGAILDKTDLPF
jgi:hypothetical protein